MSELDPEVYMLIGLPGSGKSTWIKNFFKTSPPREYAVISADDIIEQWAIRDGITYDEGFNLYQHSDVIKTLRGKLFGCAKNNYSLIIDQTNLTVSERKSKLDMIPKHYKKIAVVFDVPFEVLINQQNSPERVARGKTIPSDVLDLMISRYAAPSLAEFDEIQYAPSTITV